MACVVKENHYIEFAALDHNGNPLFWTLSEGEKIVDISPPSLRSEFSRDGLLKPVLSKDKWIEGATKEELAKWDEEHPIMPVPLSLEERVSTVEENQVKIFDELASAYTTGVNKA